MKNKITKKNLDILICLSFLIVSHTFYAQGINRRSEFSMQTPNVSEMERHELTPVNEYTGIPDISIPLTQIDFDGKIIPISLQYHAGGIRASQEASWVGLGWSLTTDAVITRQINLKSDIGTGKPGGLNNSGYCYESTIPEVITSSYESILNAPGVAYFDKRDTQPDIFTALLFGEVIKFQLTQKASTSTIQAIVLNDSKAVISFNEYYQNFTIKDDQGFVYEFTKKEYSSNFGYSGSSTRLPNDIYEPLAWDNTSFNNNTDINIVTAWHVDKITSPNGKVLNFNYKGDESASRNTNGREDLYLSLSPTMVFESKYLGGCLGVGGSITISDQNANTSYRYQRSVQENKYLREIIDESTGERIVFKTGTRNDILSFDAALNNGTSPAYSTSDNIKPPQRLTQIEIYSSSGKRTKLIKFGQSYFDSNVSTNLDNYLRLKLDNVTIDNSKYDFTYEQPNALPAKNTYMTDFWGFYNGYNVQNYNYRHPSFLLSIDMPLGQCNQSLPQYPSGLVVNGGKKGSKFDYGKIGILKRITYPTNGYTEYNFESNTIRVSNNPTDTEYMRFASMYLQYNNLESGWPLTSTSNSALKTYKVGGLRVESISNYVSNGTLLLKKKYKYDDSYGSSIPMSSGRLMDELLYFYAVDLTTDETGHLGTNFIVSSTNQVYGNNSAMGNHVGYDRVEEITIGTDASENGKIVSYFRNIPNTYLSSNLRGYVSYDAPPQIYEEGNGKILKQKIYDNIFGSAPKKEITNTYNFYSSVKVNAHKVYYSDLNVTIFIGGANGGVLSGTSSKVYDWFSYKTKKSYALLTQSIVKDNFINGSVETTKTYTYDSKPQLKSKTASTSNSSTMRDEYYYPYDTSYGVNSVAQMQSLVYNNRISQPVYIRHYNNGVFIGHELLTFGIFNSMLLPNAIKYQKNDATLNSIEERLSYKNYDDYGNIIEVSKPGGPTDKYLWGYEKKYPIAKISNAPISGTDIYSIVNDAILTNPKSTPTEIEMEINKIRGRSNYQNALITSYSFDPGVGMIQMTDPKDYAFNYTYDDQERLINVKDNNLKITSATSYNLLNQSNDNLNDSLVTLTTNLYQLYVNQNVTVSCAYPPGNVQRWELHKGDGTVLQGTGNPPASFTQYSYSTIGVKPIRLFVFYSDNNFVTGNVNVRVYQGTQPGGNVYFGNILIGNNQTSSTARLYGDPNSVITYSVDTNGSTSELTGTATVGGTTTSTTQPGSPIYKIVSIPSTGYVDCSVQTFPGINTSGTGGTYITISSTTIGQVTSPNSLTHSYN